MTKKFGGELFRKKLFGGLTIRVIENGKNLHISESILKRLQRNRSTSSALASEIRT